MNQFTGICKILLTSAIALAIMQSARAQSSVQLNATDAQVAMPLDQAVPGYTSNKKFSLTTTLTNQTDLEENSSASDDSALTLEMTPSYRISSKASVSALVAVERNQSGLEETKFLNTSLYLKRDPIALTLDTDLALTLQGVLPTEEKARQESSLKGGAGGSVKVSHKFSTLKKPSTVAYTLNALKYIHEYDRSSGRDANISYRFRNIATYDLKLTEKLSFSLTGYFQSGFTYDNVARELFYLEQSLSYDVSDNFSVALSHNTEGSAFDKNGKDWNVEAYDSRNSTIGASLTYVY